MAGMLLFIAALGASISSTFAAYANPIAINTAHAIATIFKANTFFIKIMYIFYF